ncbi:hypothetical protein KC207_09870 [Phycicoccus sp. BSK3Z-2]|uniref:Uncharacterized protein n=1 Tax=Phycicoccus avicenniae TaxID=2828860 RepID=A0A941D8N0_9MICO|nr:hypothetical protein [Phycicoccus avicenniae]MBR7743596.1 hypothetical protein [Phycicoccus avicenniae]
MVLDERSVRAADEARYVGLLAQQLRHGGLREREVERVVADLVDDARRDGGDLAALLGTPAEQADRWVTPPSWSRRLARATLSGLGSAGIIVTVWAGLASDVGWGDPRPVLLIDLLLVVVFFLGPFLTWTIDVPLARRAATRMSAARPSPGVVHVVGVSCVVAAFVLLVVLGSDRQVVLDGVPRWVLVAGGALLAPLAVVVGEPARASVPLRPAVNVRRWRRISSALLGTRP